MAINDIFLKNSIYTITLNTWTWYYSLFRKCTPKKKLWKEESPYWRSVYFIFLYGTWNFILLC